MFHFPTYLTDFVDILYWGMNTKSGQVYFILVHMSFLNYS